MRFWAHSSRRSRFATLCVVAFFAATFLAFGGGMSSADADGYPDGNVNCIDLSLIVAADYPVTWPSGFPFFQLNHHRRIGPSSPYNIDIVTIDPNTGTQMDVPPHSVSLPDSGLPTAGAYGTMFSDKAPVWQFCGEACVIDVRDLMKGGEPGRSPLIGPQHVRQWEKEHRQVGFGDIVLMRADYSDQFFRPFPEGRRFIADAIEGKYIAWPDPHPDCMTFLAQRGVLHVGTDSPSMGPIPDLAEPTHFAGLRHGMVFTEGATNLSKLPTTGAFYCMLPPKHVGSPAIEGRAFAVPPGPLATWLIKAARAKHVADLTVLLSEDLPVSWAGSGQMRHRQPYIKVEFPISGSSQHTHIFDSHAGTNLVPPAYSLPPPGFDNTLYEPKYRQLLAEYETKYGKRGNSVVTTDKVDLSQTCGWARVIDVRSLVGSTSREQWPSSPEVTPAHIENYEREHGALHAGEIVIFASGHVDRTFRGLPEGDACMRSPSEGRSEGWPAPGPEAILYLAKKGISCVATDGPTLGGVNPEKALMTYWMLGTQGMVGVEFLTGVLDLPARAYFIFAAVKIRDGHGGHGRAIALYQ